LRLLRRLTLSPPVCGIFVHCACASTYGFAACIHDATTLTQKERTIPDTMRRAADVPASRRLSNLREPKEIGLNHEAERGSVFSPPSSVRRADERLLARRTPRGAAVPATAAL